LLAILRHFPPGAEKLALRIMTILAPEGNASPGLVATIKGLLSERQLDPRFTIPIAGEMDKVSLVGRATMFDLQLNLDKGGAASVLAAHGIHIMRQSSRAGDDQTGLPENHFRSGPSTAIHERSPTKYARSTPSCRPSRSASSRTGNYRPASRN
jgi:hypothetical protein